MKKKEILLILDAVLKISEVENYPISKNKIKELIESIQNGGTRIVNYDKETKPDSKRIADSKVSEANSS